MKLSHEKVSGPIRCSFGMIEVRGRRLTAGGVPSSNMHVFDFDELVNENPPGKEQ